MPTALKRRMNQCVHYWDIDRSNRGTCRNCDTVMQFPIFPEEKPVLIKAGKLPTPRALCLNTKITIATQAKQRGIATLSQELDISTITLRGWVGRYTRGMPGTVPTAPVTKRKPGRPRTRPVPGKLKR